MVRVRKNPITIARKIKNRLIPDVRALGQGGKSYKTPVVYFTENMPKKK